MSFDEGDNSKYDDLMEQWARVKKLRRTMRKELFTCSAHMKLTYATFRFVKWRFPRAIKRHQATVQEIEEISLRNRVKLQETATRFGVIDAALTDLDVRIRLLRPPGSTVSRMLQFLLPRSTYQRHMAPTIADMQYEVRLAIQAGEPWRARWIIVRDHLRLIPTWGWGAAARVIEWLYRHW